MSNNALSLWTVYDHPRDWPHGFIARRHVISNGGSHPTAETLQALSLEELRVDLRARGLVCVARHASGDPVIVETWW